MTTPEELARQNIDKQLAACGWEVQNRTGINLFSNRGVAVRDNRYRIRLSKFDLTKHAKLIQSLFLQAY